MTGVAVIKVVKNLPAAVAGIEIGDTINSIDGNPVTDARAVSAAFASVRSDQKVSVTIVRKGKTQILVMQPRY